MILTPEEQLEYREEIDYAIDTHGYEYIWGRETVMDKTRGLIRDVPTKLIEGAKKLASNPDIIAINEKLAAHNAKLCEQDAKQRSEQPNNQDDFGKRRQRAAKTEVHFKSPLDFGNDHL